MRFVLLVCLIALLVPAAGCTCRARETTMTSAVVQQEPRAREGEMDQEFERTMQK